MVACGVSCQTRHIVTARIPPRVPGIPPQLVGARVSKGRDVPLSLCPGTKKFPCPVVPLSRDKKVLPVPLSLCPGTRAGANVPGQTPLSRDVPGQNHLLFSEKKLYFCFCSCLFSGVKKIRLFYVCTFCHLLGVGIIELKLVNLHM